MSTGDPMGKAHALSRPQLPRRFYFSVSTRQVDGGWEIVLDDRPVRTPKRRPLLLPTADLAEAVAAEWAAQVSVVDPETMPLTRLSNTAIDGVADTREAVRDDAARFAGSDLICYRASEPDGLVALQNVAWDPLVAWARTDLGLPLNLAAGVMHVAQPPGTFEAARRHLLGTDDFTLAGLHVLTSLTGSLVIALAVARGRLSVNEAFAASLVDEDWQISQWGEDQEAMRRRARNRQDMEAAVRFARHGAG